MVYEENSGINIFLFYVFLILLIFGFFDFFVLKFSKVFDWVICEKVNMQIGEDNYKGSLDGIFQLVEVFYSDLFGQ